MTKLYGLLGEKLSHSISPDIHKIIFRELNISGQYEIIQVEKTKLKDTIEGFKANFTGLNVTIPYKVNIMDFLDEISDKAKTIGAVNTISFKKGKLLGFNTDYHGFGMLLDKYNIDVNNKNVVILGTGGASKSIHQYIKDNKAREIVFVSRNPKNTEFSKVISYDELSLYKRGDVIINCTPIGMYPNIQASPVNSKILSHFESAVDLIYNPFETLFLKQAKEAGIKSVNGLYMLIGQAIVAEEIWNNIEIDRKLLDIIYSELMESIYDKP